MSLNQFLSMGGYAFYVWTSYGLAFLLLGINLVLPIVRHARVKQELASSAQKPARRRS
jgi:heme exporter protein D